MEIPSHIRAFWEAFQATVDYNASERFYEAFHFADNEKHANMLAELVLSGTKRATAGLLWTYEIEQKKPPESGALSVVTNWQSEPLCVIESTHVAIVAFNEVSERFAATEGEGDKSLEQWREVHWDYFGRECQRIGKVPNETMPVICEEFEVLYMSPRTTRQ